MVVGIDIEIAIVFCTCVIIANMYFIAKSNFGWLYTLLAILILVLESYK